MKTKRRHISLALTLSTLVLATIFILFAFLLVSTEQVTAQQSTRTPTPTPTPTASPSIALHYPFYLTAVSPFYSSNANDSLNAIFDHRYPTYERPPNLTAPDVMNYEGVERASCPPPIPAPCFSYDGHSGYDYDVEYAPIRAVAGGQIVTGTWNNIDFSEDLGLHIIVEHETADTTYYSIYGHLSAIYVSQEEMVVKGQVIGFAGNTGKSTGPHLHFEVKEGGRADTARTDPMGWQATPGTPDPWQIYSNTASTYLWASDVSAPGPEPVFDEEAMVIIDSDGDSDPDDGFHTGCSMQSCLWQQATQDEPVSGDDEFEENDGFYYYKQDVHTGGISDYWAQWTPRLEQGGCYEVLAFIPRPNTVGGEVLLANPQYTVSYADGEKTVVVAQEDAQGQFISLGAYPFLGGEANEDEYVYVSDKVFAIDSGHQSDEFYLVADAVAFVPIVENFPVSCRPNLYLSSDSDGTAGSLSYADEDILLFDPQTETWAMFFDGSDVGLGGDDSQGQDINLDAFHLEEDGTILLSHNSGVGIPLGNLTAVDDSDVVRFIPTTTGDDTAGDFTLVLDGSTVGLSANSEDIDALGRAPATGEEEEGALLISTIGNYSLPGGVTGQQEDLVAFEDGAWSIYFDGSDVDLGDTSAEDVDGAWVDPHSNDIYLTTVDSFSAGGLAGEGADIFVCAPLLLGTTTDCDYWSFLYWAGAQYGFDSQNVDAFSLGEVSIIYPVTCTQPPNCSFEDGFTDWTKSANPPLADWNPSSAQAHNGQFSAHGELYNFTGAGAYLRSDYIDIQPNTRYRASLFAIVEYPEDDLGSASLKWYEDGNDSDTWGIVSFTTNIPSWEQFFTNNGDFKCPPSDADQARFEFVVNSVELRPQLLFAPVAGLESHVYIDDVMIEEQPGVCPLLPGP